MLRFLHAIGLCFLMLAPFSAARAQTKTTRLVAFGDSLTAGYNLPLDQAYPVVLEKALRAKGYSVEIANAGVSGDTVQAGLERLDWSVPDGTDGVILELGANDMLRGFDPAQTRQGLDAIITRLKARGIPVLLMGMRAAPNLGAEFTGKFDAIYPDLAKKYHLTLYPFFLDGIAAQRALTLPDGMHPTGEGVAIIVVRSLPSVEIFLARLGATRPESRKSTTPTP